MPCDVPLRLQEPTRDREDHPVGLGVALLGDAGAIVRRAVAVHVLAVECLGRGDVVLPRLGRRNAGLGEEVGAVVDHLEVAIQGQHVGVARELLRELPEERRDVVLLEILIRRDARAEVLHEAWHDVVDRPLRREYCCVDGVGARCPVRQHLAVEVRERHRDDVDLRAGHGVEVRCAALQRLGDLRAGEGHDVDLHAVELAGRLRRPGDERQRSDARKRRQDGVLAQCLDVHWLLPRWCDAHASARNGSGSLTASRVGMAACTHSIAICPAGSGVARSGRRARPRSDPASAPLGRWCTQYQGRPPSRSRSRPSPCPASSRPATARASRPLSRGVAGHRRHPPNSAQHRPSRRRARARDFLSLCLCCVDLLC